MPRPRNPAHGVAPPLGGDEEFQCQAAIGRIALPNATSVALRQKLGFRKVADFREVGCKFDRWIDVGYWRLTHRSILSSPR